MAMLHQRVEPTPICQGSERYPSASQKKGRPKGGLFFHFSAG
jgi:hypothetical protein